MRLFDLLKRHGHLPRGRGRVTGVIALALSCLCLLAALAFHFPSWLTTPELRARYDVELLRGVMFAAMVTAAGLATWNLIRARSRAMACWSVAALALTWVLGGSRIPVGAVQTGTPYLGLDWLILGLLGTATVFIAIEKAIPHRAQAVFRKGWQLDLTYFAVNHLLIGVSLIAANHALAVLGLTERTATWVTELPLWAAILGAALVADFCQYWVHRALHEWPWLWRIHAIHHSVETMDWLAGSRLHIFETLIVRLAVLIPLYAAGFSTAAIDGYIVVVGFHAVFNHANVSVNIGWLRYIVVTPNFHHWHHGSERAAIDRNYAAHFAFLDHLFGTAVQSERAWPARYGVNGETVPRGFWGQLFYPLRRR
ncbi:MAG: sterol desaturase family protein [Pseudomonadota bacterium]